MEKQLIYDIGMNNGDDTAYYLSLGYNVVAVEAAPGLVQKAKARFKEYLDTNRLTILNVGIAECEGYLNFYVNNYDSGWSSFHLHLASRGNAGYETIKIETKTLAQVINEYGAPYYMKVDIEGYDRIALTSLEACEEMPTYLSVELYELNEINLLSQLGYKKFKIVDQQSLLPLEFPVSGEYRTFKKLITFRTSKNFFIRVIRKLFGHSLNILLEKKYKAHFSYSHVLGSSGPFGKYAFGKWHSLEEIIEVFQFYKNEFNQATGNKESGWWIDIHAKR